MASESAQYLSTLHKQIDKYFSFNDVKTLCFDLGVDYENIPGDSRSAFIRNLIVSLAKQNRLQELIDLVRRERAFVDWQDVPKNFELPTAIAQENIQQVNNYTVYGDVVQGDKIEGDNISVGNINNADGVAIGRGASADVKKTTPVPVATPIPSSSKQDAPLATNGDIQKTVNRLKKYIELVPDNHQAQAEELFASINIIQTKAAEPVDTVHLKLLCLGLVKLADDLEDSIPEQVVLDFITVVQESKP